jgi:hypothetical protein
MFNMVAQSADCLTRVNDADDRSWGRAGGDGQP